MESWITDLRLAVRNGLRRPGSCAVVIATLALGIGGTTAIFSFVHGVLLRPLPYPDADRLVVVCEVAPEGDSDWCGASPSNVADWERSSRTLEAFGLARNWSFSVEQAGRLHRVVGGVATAGLFDVFGIRAVIGRLFVPADQQAGRPRVAVVTESYWRERLGADPAAVGQPLVIDGEPHALIGVLPDAVAIPELRPAAVWVPLWPEEPGRADYRWWRGFHPFGRLAPGVRIEAARTEMEAIRARLAAQYPDTNDGWGLRVEALRSRVVRDVRPALLAFLAAVGCILLIACANVAHLLLVRATARTREFAVRACLGAGRARLARQVLAEGALFAAAGGVAGTGLAVWLVALFVRLAPEGFPRLESVGVSGPALAFAAAVSAATTLLFALAPALHAARVHPVEGLKDGRGGTARRSVARWRDALAVGEIAVALALLAGAGLLLHSFTNLLDWQPGFERSRLLTVQVFPAPTRYPDRADMARLYDRAVEQLRALPGVESAAAAAAGPLFGGDGAQEFSIAGRPEAPPGSRPRANWYDVGPGYFDTLGIPLVRGRDFDARDRPDSPGVALINQTLARRFFPGTDPLGARLHLVAHGMDVEVVGVVADTAPFRPDQLPQPEIYWPYAQVPRGAIHFVVRIDGAPGPVADGIRARLAALDPDLDVGRIVSMDEHVARQLLAPRFNASLIGLFALVALAIAGIGLFGVVSFSVAERTREIGLRIALGASRGDVLAWIVARALRLAAAGTGLGLLAAAAGASWLDALLVAVPPSDPLALGGAALTVSAVVVLACVAPARRASRVDPAVTLRQE